MRIVSPDFKSRPSLIWKWDKERETVENISSFKLPSEKQQQDSRYFTIFLHHRETGPKFKIIVSAVSKESNHRDYVFSHHGSPRDVKAIVRAYVEEGLDIKFRFTGYCIDYDWQELFYYSLPDRMPVPKPKPMPLLPQALSNIPYFC